MQCGAKLAVTDTAQPEAQLRPSSNSAWTTGRVIAAVVAVVLIGAGAAVGLALSGGGGDDQAVDEPDESRARATEPTIESSSPPATEATNPPASVVPTTTTITAPAATVPPDTVPATTSAPAPPRSSCIDDAAALSLAQPLFDGVNQVDSISCQDRVAVAGLSLPDGAGVTTAYVNESGRWSLISGSFGLRDVCEAVWAYEPGFDIGCGVNFIWPYDDYFSVPQLGVEAVRGTGCGGSGQIGDVIPDGIWNGYVLGLTADVIDFDLGCVYYGQSAQPFIDEYLATTPEDERLDYNSDYWRINNTIRGRTVPLADGFVYRAAEWVEGRGCVDPGPSADLYARTPNDVIDSWLRIENGRAVWLLTSCQYG